MRDLARSMIRFSWAMSMLGARQAANLLSPNEGWNRSADALDAVSDAATKEMGETMRGYYKTGDRVQGGMVDSVSRLFGGSWLDPGKTMNETWEAVERNWSGVRESLRKDSGDEE